MDVVDQDLRAEDQDEADPDQDDLGREVGDGEDQVEFRRLLGAADVDQRRGRRSATAPPMMSPGLLPSQGQKTAR